MISDAVLAALVAAFLITILVIASLARRAAIAPAAIDAKLADLSTRLGVVEADSKASKHDLSNVRQVLANVPTNTSISEMKTQVVQTQEKVSAMQDTLSANTRSLGRIEDYLMHTASEAIADSKRIEHKS